MAILLVFCPLTRGQELAGTFTGTITDTSGAEIPHATITITLNGVRGSSRVVQSNDSGINRTTPHTVSGACQSRIVTSFLNVAQKRHSERTAEGRIAKSRS